MHVVHDRTDAQWATKEAARTMSSPTTLDEWRIRRVVRYLKHHRVCEWTFEAVGPLSEIVATCDSDWGGQEESRRSTSGGVLKVQGCTVLTWARTQTSVSMSSAEAVTEP